MDRKPIKKGKQNTQKKQTSKINVNKSKENKEANTIKESKQVFVMGATNIDFTMFPPHFPKPGELIVCPAFTVDAGGKANGQACALAKLGVPTYLISCIGKMGTPGSTDGDLVNIEEISQWKQLGLKTNFVEKMDGKTGACLILSSEGTNIINEFMGNNVKISKEQVDKSFKEAKEGDYFLSTYEANEDVVEHALIEAKKKKMRTFLSPAPIREKNIRLDLVDFLIVYDSELKAITGIDIEGGKNTEKIEEAYKILTTSIDDKDKRNPSMTLIVCLGLNKGSLYIKGDGVVLFKARQVDIVDKTLCRASFIGGFISSLFKGNGLLTCLKYANGAMTFCATIKGSIKALPTDSDVQKYICG